MLEKSGPIIKIEEFKRRLVLYLEREFPGIFWSEQEVFELVDESLGLLDQSKTDFLDKFLVNWRGYNTLSVIQWQLVMRNMGKLSILDVCQRMWDAREELFGQDLAEASAECVKSGEYNEWYFNTRYHMWRNGTWPIVGSRL
jgi:hypothetical protein